MSDPDATIDDPTIDVRRAAATDVPGLVASSKALFLEDAAERDPSSNLDWPDRFGAEMFAAAVDDASRLLLVAVVGDEVRAHLSGKLEEPSDFVVARTAVLRSLHVDPSLRSSGVGARMVDEFVAWAEAAGSDALEVTANWENPRAIAFYERCGFRRQHLTLRRTPG